jgi:hypothetical protein
MVEAPMVQFWATLAVTLSVLVAVPALAARGADARATIATKAAARSDMRMDIK